MFRHGRQTDPGFDEHERLYLRFPDRGYGESAADLSVERVLKENLPDASQSFNRSRYSEPTDVLFESTRPPKRWGTYLNWGVLALELGVIPQLLPYPEGDQVYSFEPEHVPLWDNYGHTEVHIEEDGRRLAGRDKPPALVRREYRRRLALTAEICRSPSPGRPIPWVRWALTRRVAA